VNPIQEDGFASWSYAWIN